jgi:hypothetical protein
MLKNPIVATLLTLAVIAILTIGVYFFPPVHERFAWRVEMVTTWVRMSLQPAGDPPTPIPQPTWTPEPSPTATIIPSPTSTQPGPTPTFTPTPTQIPGSIVLPAPAYEKQGANECGPTTLAIYLHYYNWTGTKDDVSSVVKPNVDDRNVNVEELVYFVRNHAGWLNVEYRLGGDLPMLKRLIAAGIPVMIEETFHEDRQYWPNDDMWAAHYLLVSGYNDASQTFTAQDSYRGPNREVPYATLAEDWKAFNYVYIMIYRPEQEAAIQSVLGSQWDMDASRQHALEVAQAETGTDPQDKYAWFNLGTNLVYFERYNEAARAYDTARQIGLPQRMMRYQFGPFLAYFHSARFDDLLAVTDYLLKNTPNSEEGHLWHGWALYRKGDTPGAIKDFQQALTENPNYQDAKYALDFLGANP